VRLCTGIPLGKLALDPHGRELFDVGAEAVGDVRDRPNNFCAGGFHNTHRTREDGPSGGTVEEHVR
jgi:hypothetical protein